MIDIVKSVLNQTAVLRKKTGVNEYNEPTFTNSNIKCRIRAERNLIKDELGKEITSSTVVVTVDDIAPRDRILYNGIERVVIDVHEWVDIDGSSLGRRVFL